MINASPILTRTAIVFGFFFVIAYGLTFVDARLLYGVSVWEKPSKFFLSLAVHMATLAWGISLLPQEQQRARSIRIASFAFVAAALFELTYMNFQAARGEASHFNVGDPVHALLFAMMGAGALTLTSATGYLGWRILRSGHSVLNVATGWSFMISAVTTTLVAGYLSSGTSHWIGGDQTDATGLPFVHWSTTGGDLRAAHFAVLHMMQVVPLVAWFWNSKRVSLATLAGGFVVVGLLAGQALMGIPLFRV